MDPDKVQCMSEFWNFAESLASRIQEVMQLVTTGTLDTRAPNIVKQYGTL